MTEWLCLLTTPIAAYCGYLIGKRKRTVVTVRRVPIESRLAPGEQFPTAKPLRAARLLPTPVTITLEYFDNMEGTALQLYGDGAVTARVRANGRTREILLEPGEFYAWLEPEPEQPASRSAHAYR